jgi:hypothetical protein
MSRSQHLSKVTVFAVVLLVIGGGAAFAAPAAAQSSTVQEDSVQLGGSTVTINTGGAGAIGVDDLPSDVSVSSISDGGAAGSSNPDGIAWSSASGLPDTVSFTLTPSNNYEAGDTISFTVDGISISLTIQAQGSDSTREVALSGSTISVETGGAGAFGVDNLPVDRVDISNVSDGGGIPGPNPDGLAWSSAVGLPDTVSFKLTPGSSYEAGDTITFTADGTQITLEVVEVSTPAEISDEVSSEQYKTVAGNDGEVTQSEMISSFNDWFNSEDGSIGDTEFKQRDTTQLFNYWFNKGS